MQGNVLPFTFAILLSFIGYLKAVHAIKSQCNTLVNFILCALSNEVTPVRTKMSRNSDLLRYLNVNVLAYQIFHYLFQCIYTRIETNMCACLKENGCRQSMAFMPSLAVSFARRIVGETDSNREGRWGVGGIAKDQG